MSFFFFALPCIFKYCVKLFIFALFMQLLVQFIVLISLSINSSERNFTFIGRYIYIYT